MELSLFSDTYIATNIVAIERRLEQLPQVSCRQHKGREVVFAVYGTARKEYGASSPKAQEALALQKERKELELMLSAFSEEAAKRKLSDLASTIIEPVPTALNASLFASLVPNSNSYPRDNTYYDAHGNKMRSRAEQMVGSTLDNMGLQYKYEPLIQLDNGDTISPDFVVLVPSIERFFMLEFAGMTDNRSYLNKLSLKIGTYLNSGYQLGRDILIISGTSTYMPAAKLIKILIASTVNALVEEAVGG